MSNPPVAGRTVQRAEEMLERKRIDMNFLNFWEITSSCSDVNTRILTLNKKIDGVNQKVNNDYSNINRRTDNSISAIDKNIGELRDFNKVDSLRDRLDRLEKKLNDTVDKLENIIEKVFLRLRERENVDTWHLIDKAAEANLE
ncbi:MAG: hypothetical protein M1813_009098 [Trichoglossum hirsutum]|nr:MAG: hypothetical protein M1813_009098 [Trichoglossum hirsutum]